jgi:hypothetical protein
MMGIWDKILDILRRQRRYANFFEWPNKQRKELGVVEELLKAMRLSGAETYHSPGFGPSPNVAPDCIVVDNSGSSIAIEVCEFVSEEAIRINQKEIDVIKAKYRDWLPNEVVEEVKAILMGKDGKTYHGGPYHKICILIFSDERVVTYGTCADVLKASEFGPFKNISEAYFMFSYDPGFGYCPYMKLTIRNKGNEANILLANKRLKFTALPR